MSNKLLKSLLENDIAFINDSMIGSFILEEEITGKYTFIFVLDENKNEIIISYLSDFKEENNVFIIKDICGNDFSLKLYKLVIDKNCKLKYTIKRLKTGT